MGSLDLYDAEQPIDPRLLMAIEAAFHSVSLTPLEFATIPRAWRKANPKGSVKGPKTVTKQYLRLQIARRDGTSCAYCGREFIDLDQATLDHVIPNCVVGHWKPWNLLLTCHACNNLKGDKIPVLMLPLLCHLLIRLAEVAQYKRETRGTGAQTKTPPVPTNGYPSKKAARRAQKAKYQADWTRGQVRRALDAMQAPPLRLALEAAPVRAELPVGGQV